MHFIFTNLKNDPISIKKIGPKVQIKTPYKTTIVFMTETWINILLQILQETNEMKQDTPMDKIDYLSERGI